MRTAWLFSFNLILILVATFVLSILQSSFQPLAGFSYLVWIPTPFYWLPVIVYLSLYRKPFEGIVTAYIIMAALINLTVTNSGLLLMLCLFTFATCQLIKSRVFWNGSRYFVLLCAISTLVVQTASFLLNWMFFDFIEFPNILLWALKSLLTMIPAWFCFHLLNLIDHITHKEPLTEVTGGSFA